MAKILVVGPDYAEAAVGKCLTAAGHQVRLTASGIAGFNLATGEFPDVVITALTMVVGVDGLELIELLRRSSYAGPVVGMAGPDEQELAVAALHAGAVAIICADASPEEVMQQLNRALAIADARTTRFTAASMQDAFAALVSGSKVYRKLKRRVTDGAREPVPVFIHGERGTGRFMVARIQHELSERASRPFLVMPNISLPAEEQERLLFTASEAAGGLLALAAGGTLYIEEVGGLALPVQERLLRLLRPPATDGMVTSPPDLRLIVATEKNIASEVSLDRFHRDLYYLLEKNSMYLPPLRRQPQDIPAIAQGLLRLLGGEQETVPRLSQEIMEKITGYHWPGNVCQLSNVIKYLLKQRSHAAIPVTAVPQFLREPRPPAAVSGAPPPAAVVEQYELRVTLAETAGDLRHAAGLLGLAPNGLQAKLERYGIGEAEAEVE